MASLAVIFVFLTSIRGWEYHLFVKGGTNSELNRREGRAAQKSKHTQKRA
jgi:hypothetical protein